jgi:hypothetical protein
MEIGKAFTFIFQDKRWFTKLLLGWLVSIVPILNFAWAGYLVKTLRNVEQDKLEPLAEWDEFGEKFVQGFFLFLAGLVYSLPALIIGSFTIFPALLASGESSDTFATIMAVTGSLVGCLLLIYALALTILFPALYINLARKGTLGSTFQIGEFFRIMSRNAGAYFLAWLMAIVWTVVIFLVGGLLFTLVALIPCIGWIAAIVGGGLMGVIVSVVWAHLFGQVAAKDALAA